MVRLLSHMEFETCMEDLIVIELMGYVNLDRCLKLGKIRSQWLLELLPIERSRKSANPTRNRTRVLLTFPNLTSSH